MTDDAKPEMTGDAYDARLFAGVFLWPGGFCACGNPLPRSTQRYCRVPGTDGLTCFDRARRSYFKAYHCKPEEKKKAVARVKAWRARHRAKA